jgi:hypothetical protein
VMEKPLVFLVYGRGREQHRVCQEPAKHHRSELCLLGQWKPPAQKRELTLFFPNVTIEN